MSGSLVLKLQKRDCCISKYFQEHYNMLYHESCARSILKNVPVPGIFFNTNTSSEAPVIAIVEANPLVEISDCHSCVHLLHVFFPKKSQNRYKGLFPNTNFYMALYSRFCGFIEITFTHPLFI